MIRVPSIAIHRPWPLLGGRKQASAPTRVADRAERELVRRRVHAFADAERTAVLSASVNGRRFI